MGIWQTGVNIDMYIDTMKYKYYNTTIETQYCGMQYLRLFYYARGERGRKEDDNNNDTGI